MYIPDYSTFGLQSYTITGKFFFSDPCRTADLTQCSSKLSLKTLVVSNYEVSGGRKSSKPAMTMGNIVYL